MHVAVVFRAGIGIRSRLFTWHFVAWELWSGLPGLRAVGRMRRERRDEMEISARVICYFLMHKLHHADTPHFYIVKLECTLSNLFSSGAWIVGDRRSCLLEAVQACTHNLRFVQIIELFQQTNLQQKIVIFSAIDKKRCIA